MSAEIGVSKTAVYDKLNRLEPNVSKALVKSTALDKGDYSSFLRGGTVRTVTRISNHDERVPLRLTPTRDGETEIALLTNLPETDASSVLVAQLYRKRWRVETLFQVATENFHCEIKTLGYPRAALFSFCMAKGSLQSLFLSQSRPGECS